MHLSPNFNLVYLFVSESFFLKRALGSKETLEQFSIINVILQNIMCLDKNIKVNKFIISLFALR